MFSTEKTRKMSNPRLSHGGWVAEAAAAAEVAEVAEAAVAAAAVVVKNPHIGRMQTA